MNILSLLAPECKAILAAHNSKTTTQEPAYSKFSYTDYVGRECQLTSKEIVHLYAKRIKYQTTANENYCLDAVALSLSAKDNWQLFDTAVKLNKKIREHKPDIWRFFSQELAHRINSNQIDITAAVILYGLYLWQKTPIKAFGYVPKINGERACYRSLRELQKTYPYWDDTTILKAINRAEKALKGDFIVQRNKDVLHYQIKDNLLKMFAGKKGFIGYMHNDAVKYGVRSAILLANLKYQTLPEHNRDPLVDDEGNIYRQLSPTKLTKPTLNEDGVMKRILLISRDSVSDELIELKNNKVIKEHPEKIHFYTIVDCMKVETANEAKVSRREAEVSTNEAEVSTPFVKTEHNPLSDSTLHNSPSTLNSNTTINPVRKCLKEETAPLRSTVSSDKTTGMTGKSLLVELLSNSFIHRTFAFAWISGFGSAVNP